MRLSGRSLAVALLAAGALSMENLDGTILATGLPTMAGTFHVPVVDLNLGVTAYLLTLAVFIPISGWMADRWGARTVFSSAIAIFTVASIGCGLSHTLTQFTLARILQGIGGSMMVPVGRLMVVRETPKEHMMETIAYTIWPSLFAPILGPPLGGWIISIASWRWMFLINVPIGIILLVFTLWLVRDGEHTRGLPFDWAGFALVGVSCLSGLIAMEWIGRQPVAWTRVILCMAISAACGIAAVRHLRKAEHPIFDPRVFHVLTFRATQTGGSFFRMAIFMTPFLLPLMFQVAFGMSALASGSLVMAVFAGNLSMKAIANWMLRTFGFRHVLIANGIFTACTLAACAAFSPGTARWLIGAVLFFSGLGRSMQLTSLTTLGFADVSTRQMSSASTLTSMVSQLNTSIGVALGAIVLRIAAYAGFDVVTQFRAAFAVVALLALVSVVWWIALPKNAGSAVSGRVIGDPETAA